MLAGKRAFEGPSAAALLTSVLRDPQARYSCAAELSQDLRSCSELLFSDSSTVFTPARFSREVKRPFVLLPLLLVIILLAAGVTWLVKRSRDARWAHTLSPPSPKNLMAR